MAFALTAIVSLLMMPTLKVDVHYSLGTEQIANMMSKEEGSNSSEFDYKEVLGEEGINVNLGISLSSKALLRSVTSDATTVVNEEIIEPNVENITDSMRSMLFSMGSSMLKFAISKSLPALFDDLIDKAKPEQDTRTAEEIRGTIGMDNAYFSSFANDIISVIRSDKPTVTMVNNMVCDSMNNAIDKLNEGIDGFQVPKMSEEDKNNAREMTVNMLNSLGMVKEDNESLYPFATVVDALVVTSLSSSSNNGSNELENLNVEQRAAKLKPTINDYVKNMIPGESYDTMALVLKILLIVIGVFVLMWALYFLYTFFRTIFAKKKVWTFTGPIFWIMGIIQIILGVVATALAAVMLNGSMLSTIMNNSGSGSAEASEAMAGLKVSLMTCTFVPSIILLIMIPTTITYFVLKQKYKRQLKAEAQQAQ